MYREFLRSRRPRSMYCSKEYFFASEGGPLSMIAEELYQVIEMKVWIVCLLSSTFVSDENAWFDSNDSTRAQLRSSNF